jgi:hypothetical protein
LTSQFRRSISVCSPARLAIIGIFLMSSVVVVRAQAQSAQTQPPTVQEDWDALLQESAEVPSPILTAPQVRIPGASKSSLADHFFFESRSQYWRYNTRLTGQPTVTGIINAPPSVVFNPNGYPYPQVFQPNADRAGSVVDFGTRGWISDRINTHVALRYDQDINRVNAGAPGENIIETYFPTRRFELLDAFLEFRTKPSDGLLGGASFQVGRMTVQGPELAQLDGGSFTLNRPRFTATFFGGRRYTYYSDPVERGIGGASVNVRLNPDTSIEYEGLWYIRGNHSAVLRRRFGRDWTWNTYFRMYGTSPVDFSSNMLYSPNGRTSINLGFFQKLTNKDFFYDYTYRATDKDPYNLLQRLNLGPMSQYSQLSAEAHQSVTPRLRVGAALTFRRLNSDEQDQGPFDTSFEDYRFNTQFFVLPRIETFVEYHRRSSDRLSPLNPTSFDDISHSGETNVKDMTGELRRTFGEGRVNLHGGVYYRRISLQDQFFIITGEHQSGLLAGAWLRLDQHTRLSVDYNLDNDFFLFMPDIRNSRLLQVGLNWRY